jgi:hypothetical protein
MLAAFGAAIKIDELRVVAGTEGESSRRGGTKKQGGQPHCELVASVKFRFLPDSAEAGIASAITVVTAAVPQRAICRWKPFTQFAVTLLCTLALIAGFAFGAYLIGTSPGRAALAGGQFPGSGWEWGSRHG